MALNAVARKTDTPPGPKRDAIIYRQLCHFCRADIQLGMGVAAGLGIDIGGLLPSAGVRT